MRLLVHSRNRRALRRAVELRCCAVATISLRFVGQRALDLSPRGMLIACDDTVQIGELVNVVFEPPGGGPWMQVEAEVARRIEGYRPFDQGFCAGLRFVGLGAAERGELVSRLVGMPPPVPRRPLRMDYAETVRRVALAA